MRIEQVTPCEHATGWNTTEHGEHRRVLDGFPPEARQAAVDAFRAKWPEAGIGASMDDALDAAWRVLTGDEEMSQDALDFALSRIGEAHKHHRHCVHNVPAEQQKADWRRRVEEQFPDNPDAYYDIIYGNSEPVVITPDDWEIEVPDLDFSAYEGDSIPRSIRSRWNTRETPNEP